MGITTETRVGLFVLIAIGIFFYMTFQIGSFKKWGAAQHNSYTVFLKDVVGVGKNADIKIAGVKVGWLISLELNPKRPDMVRAVIAVDPVYQVYADSAALVRQDGILGLKYIELRPGCSDHELIPSGGTINAVCDAPVAMDDLLAQVQRVGAQMEILMGAMQTTLDACKNDERLQRTIDQCEALIDQLNSLCQKNSITSMMSHADNTLMSLNSITTKIDQGQGALGKLVNNEELYTDATYCLQRTKDCITKLDSFCYIVDARNENLKGYVDLHLYPGNDLFCTVGAAAGLPGTALNLQLGKLFDNIFAVRAGVFENSLGAAVDYNIQFNDRFRWLTTLELSDFAGCNRECDESPHLKWLNRFFLGKNLYIDVGADNFTSHQNASGFVGIGVRFGNGVDTYMLP